MKFALYHPWIYLRSGLERTFMEVLRRSRHDWTWYTNYYRPDETFPELSNLRIAPLPREIAPVRSPLAAVPTIAALLTTRIPDGCDATLMSLNGLSDLALARARRPIVGFCHTPLKSIFDPAARSVMRERRPAKHAVISAAAPGFAAADRLLWRRIERVIANSAETKSRIVQGRLFASDQIDVMHPGVDLERFTPGVTERGTNLLAAGRISWYKNFELAIETVRELTRRDRAVELVIAGFLHPSDATYLASLRSQAAGLPVHFILDPTDDELAELYRTSDLMLFTAVNEDFGITPVEAMACATPVVAVDAGGPRETVINGTTGWLVDDDPVAFAAAVSDWQDRTDKAVVRASARARAEEFNWQRFVDHVDQVMEGVVRRE